MPNKKPNYVFATRSTLVFAPSRCRVVAGQAWHADHPVVRDHPDLFNDEPVAVYPLGWEAPEVKVEQATAAPGEKRTTKRATKRAAHVDND